MIREGVRRGGTNAPASRVKTLDEFLDFPHLYVLFRLILTHFFSNRFVGRLLIVWKKDRSRPRNVHSPKTFRPVHPDNLGQVSSLDSDVGLVRTRLNINDSWTYSHVQHVQSSN
jgi:hypothetical protein